MIKDFTGKEMHASTVFSACIRYFKQHIMQHFELVAGVVDAQWILTVPAIWSDAAKQFMRQAAEQVTHFEKIKLKINNY